VCSSDLFGPLLVIVALLGLLVAPPAAGADVVELTSGERIVGTVKDATPSGVVVHVRGKDVRIPQPRVRSITFGDEPERAATAAKPPTTRTPARSAAVAEVPPPPLRPTPPHVAAALAALAALQDATITPPDAAEYTERIDAVRRAVDDALHQGPDDAVVRTALAAALHYHAFAAYALGIYEARGDLGAIAHDAVVAQCIPLSELITRDAEQLKLNPSDPNVIGLLSATEGAPPLRACAAQKMAEAESFARTPR